MDLNVKFCKKKLWCECGLLFTIKIKLYLEPESQEHGFKILVVDHRV